jgi:tetratricopeptide (TPR) repeat protein
MISQSSWKRPNRKAKEQITGKLSLEDRQRTPAKSETVAAYRHIETDNIHNKGGSNSPRSAYDGTEPIRRFQPNILQIENGLEHFESSFDELATAVLRKRSLRHLIDILEHMLYRLRAISDGEKEKCQLHHSLAVSHAKLGNYTEAARYYRAAIPYLYFEPEDAYFNDIELFCTRLKNEFRMYHIEVLLHYIEFAIDIRQNLDVTERILGLLPMLAQSVGRKSLTGLETRKITLLTIQASNARGDTEEAFKHLCACNAMFGTTFNDIDTGLIALEKAKVYANKEPYIYRRTALDSFVFSMTMCTIVGGLWHESTLEVLYHFGITLLQWDDREAAFKVLEECCLGTWHRFGPTHPYFFRAWRELEKCEGSTSSLRAQIHWEALEDQERLSIAYKHIFVDTVVDLLSHVPNVDFVGLEHAFGPSYNPLPKHRLAVRRILTRCMGRRGDYQGALETIKADLSDSKLWDVVILRLDRIRILSQDRGIEAASDETRFLLHLIGGMEIEPLHQAKLKAIQRRLVTLGVTHFIFQTTSAASELVMEQDTETLGTGTFSIVHSVKVGHELYARKSFVLPRFRQHQVRSAIQNELVVTRKLVHPHTVRVFFTYEEKARFHIVMEPLADCDLEAFFEQRSSNSFNGSDLRLIRKWFHCLANTLAFIHSKGIRHKDIKPRNILVKNRSVIFADFGSSHAFFDEGGSTTEGPAYGYTRMYCAPEVIEQGRRNRAADVFSLSCVFADMAVWATGHEGLGIRKWHDYRETEFKNMPTNAYHASLSKVEQWFRTCADENTRTLYNDVLSRMLCTNPGERLNCIQISQAFTEIAQQQDWEVNTCSKCRIDLWLDLPAEAKSEEEAKAKAEQEAKEKEEAEAADKAKVDAEEKRRLDDEEIERMIDIMEANEQGGALSEEEP